MIFIVIDEIKVRKFQSLINDISELDNAILDDLELMSIEEIKSYLKGKYDTDYIFSRTGTDRSPLIRRLVIDYLICYLWERTNSNEIPDSLMERCDKNTAFLQKIASGKISPDLPTLDPDLQPTVMFRSGSESVFNNINNID